MTIILCADCGAALADNTVGHECAAQRRANRKAQRSARPRVECQECHHRWSTTNADPLCPRCGAALPEPTAVSDGGHVVECQRGPGSVAGAATALLKRDGRVRTFPSEAAARAEAARLNAATVSPNVSYAYGGRR